MWHNIQEKMGVQRERKVPWNLEMSMKLRNKHHSGAKSKSGMGSTIMAHHCSMLLHTKDLQFHLVEDFHSFFLIQIFLVQKLKNKSFVDHNSFQCIFIKENMNVLNEVNITHKRSTKVKYSPYTIQQA